MGSESGDENERPLHQVSLSAFYLDQHEVTNARFAVFLNSVADTGEIDGWLKTFDNDIRIHRRDGSWQPDDGYAEHPVVLVTWYGAAAYCSWAGKRLPTEAEWEKAARGTMESGGWLYPWGDQFDSSKLNYCDASCELSWRDAKYDGHSRTAPVGSYPQGKSPYGAMDMAGNVWEWVADAYGASYYKDSPDVDPQGPADGSERVHRGGSWDSNAGFCRVTLRYHVPPTHSAYTLGFRCARSP